MQAIGENPTANNISLSEMSLLRCTVARAGKGAGRGLPFTVEYNRKRVTPLTL
jgi:hypothetical protein